MIQFRWKRLPATYSQDKHGNASVALGEGVTVDGHPCVLQYKLHFVPTTKDTLEFGGKITTLKEGRECDTQWRDVTIDLSAS